MPPLAIINEIMPLVAFPLLTASFAELRIANKEWSVLCRRMRYKDTSLLQGFSNQRYVKGTSFLHIHATCHV